MSATQPTAPQTHISVAIGNAPRAQKIQFLRQLSDGDSLASLKHHLSPALLRDAEEICERCHNLCIGIIPYTSDHYPPLLRACSAPPAALYIKKQTPSFSFPAKMVAVVGTRAASVEMCQRTSLLSLQLAQHGIPVVSGLALGVDGAAHRGALTATTQCPTIAVVAHGLDRIYPPSHTQLAESILLKGGVIISEYPPGTEPLKHHFLERNRIIAALALGVVVVQAGERSGSLVTARFAADFGRDVFVMDSADGDASFSGGANLIEDGAIPISSAREVLEEYGIQEVVQGATSASGWQTLTIDDYRNRTGYSASEMLRLEMEGLVVRLPGNKVSVMLR